MDSQQTISVLALSNLLQTAESFGVKREALLKECNITPEMLSTTENRIDISTFDAIVSKAVELTGDEYFGVHMGRDFTFHSGNIVTYITCNCNNFGEACDKYFKYQSIISKARRIGFDTTGETVKISLKLLNENLQQKRHILDYMLSCLFYGSQQIVVTPIHFDRLELTHKKDELAEGYEKLFGCEILWEQPVTALYFDKKHLKTAIHQPNPELLKVLEEQANQLLLRLNNMETYTYKVLEIISRYSHDFHFSIEDIAAKIFMTPRNLQMKLKSENTTYSELVNSVRKEKSIKLLQDGVSIAETSFMLGFSETSAFQKSFKKWTGRTPGEYRSGYSLQQ